MDASLHAVVTAGATGLGREVARQLAERGFDVIITSRDAGRAQLVASDIADAGNVRALAVPLNLADDDSIQRAADTIAAELPRLDALVNNAATPTDWSEHATTAASAAIESALRTNVLGTWVLTQRLLPLLLKSPAGRIVNVSSGAGSHTDTEFGLEARAGLAASYGVSKAAVNALTSSLAAELANTPVKVNAVCPGLTATWPGAEEMGARPPSQSATGVVWAATLGDDGPSGGFFRDRLPLPW